MLVQTLLQSPINNADTILCEIDSKILQWSQALLDNITLGFKNKIPHDSFNTLTELRDIFVYTYKRGECLDRALLAIQKYTNTNC